MVIKIDLEKVYDSLEWSFIKMVLEHFNFPSNIINLIMSYMALTSTSILFNVGKLNPFQPSRGIRQSDPISPYLFLLCMEFLAAQITNMCEEKNWDKIKASRDGLSFSHVFFTGDLMLFAKANSKNCEAIIEVLDNFCNLTGPEVSLTKSCIYFSNNVSSRRKRNICKKMGIKATNNLVVIQAFPSSIRAGMGMLLTLQWKRSMANQQGGKLRSYLEQEDWFFSKQQLLLQQTTTCNATPSPLKCTMPLTRL